MTDTGAADARLLDGRLVLRQPARGHRVGTDTMLLAACIADPGDLVVDAGAGVGAVGLAVALRAPDAQVRLLERQADLAAIAEENAAANGLAARTRVLACDLLVPASRRAAGLANGTASAVLTNPPYYEQGAVRASPHGGRAQAHVLGEGGVGAWMRACLALMAPGGRFAMIHLPQALKPILEACEGRLGAVRILPVHARAVEDAGRVIITGRKGSRAPLAIAPGFVVHRADGGFTAEAEAIHRGAALLARE
ncbi:MAG: tRNA1(Val) (adenine(37)-N6)-methyltransferase [Beijerinckiaceae bacterium]